MEANEMNNAAGAKCSICGEELTAYGSKILLDGVLCRDCASLLSEWLTDEALKQMRKAKIKNHLKYRRENADRLQLFSPNRTADGKYKLNVDEDSRTFVISKQKDYVKANADVVKLSAIRSIRAYQQPCPDSSGVDIIIRIELKSRKFDSMSFRVNEFPGAELGSEVYADAKKTADNYLELFKEVGISERKISRDYGE